MPKKHHPERRVARVKFPDEWGYKELFTFCVSRLQENIAEIAAGESVGKKISLLSLTPEGVKYPTESEARMLVTALSAYMKKYLDEHPDLNYNFRFWYEPVKPPRFRIMCEFSEQLKT